MYNAVTSVRLEGITKRYGKTLALNGIDLEVDSGEIFTLLGPSGCGKTTTLRVIAGFEVPDKGRVYFDHEDVTAKKPYERGTAMVFQNYALWPHMKVFDNIAYGLRLRKISEAEVRRRVKRILDIMGLTGLEDRYPSQLSGGQQQRVALARALVVEPRVLLLDEPLSNLDARLRLKMREEIISLQRKLGITTIYVTHDQEEAMSISHRLAVMNKGVIVQVGTPREVYTNPANLFVATFMGRATLLQGIVVGQAGQNLYKISVGSGLEMIGYSRKGLKEGEEVLAVIRPESFYKPHEDSDRVNIIQGVVDMVMFVGSQLHVKVRSDTIVFMAFMSNKERIKVGDRLVLAVSPEDVKIYPYTEDVEELIHLA